MLRQFQRTGLNCELDANAAAWVADQLERLDALETKLRDTPPAGVPRPIAINPESRVKQPE